MSTPDEQREQLDDDPTAVSREAVNAVGGQSPLYNAPMQILTSQQTQSPLIELFAVLGHEFRTPLTVIKGYTSTLLSQRQHLAPEEQDEFLQMIQQAGKRLEIVTERLFEIAKLQAGLFQPDFGLVDIPMLAREAIVATRLRVPASLQGRFAFHLQCRDSDGTQVQVLPLVRGDVRCLRKVLGHLLENAVHYSPTGGRVDVIVRPAPQNGTVSKQHLPDDTLSFLEICICDFGIGIPDEHLERIFDAFYQVDTSLTREVNGLGLGLAACKHLVALHQGRIWAESCSAGGSAFHVWLPLGEQPSVD